MEKNTAFDTKAVFLCVFCAFFSIKEVELGRGRWYNIGVPGRTMSLWPKYRGGGYSISRSPQSCGSRRDHGTEAGKSEKTSLRTAHGRT